MTTKERLMQVLAEFVPAEDYLNAENIARRTEAVEGTLTDLRAVRAFVLNDIDILATDIDRLVRDVNELNADRARSISDEPQNA